MIERLERGLEQEREQLAELLLLGRDIGLLTAAHNGIKVADEHAVARIELLLLLLESGLGEGLDSVVSEITYRLGEIEVLKVLDLGQIIEADKAAVLQRITDQEPDGIYEGLIDLAGNLIPEIRDEQIRVTVLISYDRIALNIADGDRTLSDELARPHIIQETDHIEFF